MSAAKYPNRNALRKALDIYLDAMYPFVSECLEDDIEEVEEKDIAHFIRTYWYDFFQEKFEIIERYSRTRYYDARTVTSLIVEGRNRVSHQRLNELDPEFTRAQLFFIAELLGEIGKLNAQREVEAIRDDLFSDDTAECLAELEQHLVAYKQKNTELSEQIDVKEKQRKKLDRQLKGEKKRTAKLRSDLSDVKKRLEESEAAQAEYQERFEAESKKLKEPKEERKEFKATKTKSRKKNMTIAERFVSETTEDTRNELARKVVELRINATGSRPTSWKRVRAKLDLANDHFHKVIRPSKGYREAVIARIKFLKAQEGGWEYSGKLDVLTGIDDLTEEELA